MAKVLAFFWFTANRRLTPVCYTLGPDFGDTINNTEKRISMDNPILKNSMQLFAQLGRVKSRSMFGGFGIFIDDTMFALAVNNKLHIRTNRQTIAKFKQLATSHTFIRSVGSPLSLSISHSLRTVGKIRMLS